MTCGSGLQTRTRRCESFVGGPAGFTCLMADGVTRGTIENDVQRCNAAMNCLGNAL